MKNVFSSLRPSLPFASAPVSPGRSASRFPALVSAGIALMLFAVSADRVSAQVVYDETIMGDLSNSGLSPTPLVLQLGANLILGSTGRAAAIDRDYFSVTIQSGLVLSALLELPGTQAGGGLSFLGLQAGSQLTVSPNAANAVGLLGWTHYSPTGAFPVDLLPEMAIPSAGSAGFTLPLGAGSYSFWIQDFNAGTSTYGFDLRVTSAVPEPSTYAVLGSAFLGLLVLRRSLVKRARR